MRLANRIDANFKGARLRQQCGPTASKRYAAALYRNHNKGLSEKRNWVLDTRKVALPPLLDTYSERARPRPVTPIPIWRRRIARLPLVPPVPSWPFLRLPRTFRLRPRDAPLAVWSIRIPRSRPAAGGITARTANSLLLFPTRVAHLAVHPKRRRPPGRIPPPLVVNGAIGLGGSGNRERFL